MVRFDESVQLRKYLLVSLESLYRISEFLDNGKTRFMLKQFSLADYAHRKAIIKLHV